ncbi:glycoside hydrolase family 16 protein [Polaribacter cellanae]|uniref:Glycoside hydrolase family 16 protein n=1 Tax=Polaribacter cellanae TaxID=2818493 RepID=A0A975H700_9FLAO|nr:glycoside hydrolase family 16 protein [Polaribacter cellanae]QTE22469.1 glycoside hydrolase family 16 protein [Polaribacter cellanae]
MKKNKIFNLLFVLIVTTFFSCQENEYQFGEIVAPSNITIDFQIVGADAANPNGDGSGVVKFSAKADNAVSYTFYTNDEKKVSPSGIQTINYSTEGTITYSVNVVATGTGGISSSKIIEVTVFSSYAPPADLITMLTNDSSQTWRVKSEAPGHFGVGPETETSPIWYAAAPGEKSITGMYDDAYVFNVDGTIKYITNSTNDDPTIDVSGTIFGQAPPMDQELGNIGIAANPGNEYENYPLDDFDGTWKLSAPNAQETISLSGNGFFGFYVGGSHSYQIITRSATEMTLKTIGADGLAWFVVLTNEPVVNNNLNSAYNTLVWEDDFNTDGAPNTANWTYDLGAGGWGNNELQTYTNNAENVIVEGGMLKIKAKANGSGYTSARLKSEGLQEFTYGRYEVRAKLPASQGTWPAIWMLGANFSTVSWPAAGEIDIMEQTGADKTQVLSTLHYPGNFGGGGPSEKTTLATSTTEFHNYTVEWSATKIKFAIDDVVYHTFDNDSTTPFNADFFFILNVAMGGTLGGTVDPAFTEDMMEIDYVKVFQ